MIHPTAIIHHTAIIGENVEIGPFSIIEEKVKIGSGCKIGSSVCIGSHTVLGRSNHIFQGVVVGSAPLDKTYKDEKTYVIVGDNNVVREYSTISKGTLKGDGITRVGNNNFIMTCVHIGHDVVMGSHIVIASSAQIGGHVEIEDNVTIGGLTGIHQFCKIGRLSMIGAVSKVSQDIVPYSLVDGSRASICGVNMVGLKRSGLSNDEIKIIKEINSILFRRKLLLTQSIDIINKMPQSEFKQHTLDFLHKSKRGIARMKRLA
ncbi:acyl-[acyl-carrier-protein]--UDP-N-acetylglucosamine O-acyltransferase [Paenibacillus uliginis N3/975]|uniref:Acyl-[acyl-carrier-protein]--UDP-N-acetylglucosamine O-acyltransferase n=1 Tax=Paenibacillus uliginis N3/975 TaxID=1313296 RepID=A0A1X7GAG2_9BACL|nr:acyl-ACP--UDP-N-acetylglucosamine O-acyltransferase [Paenibacillus uliginis]SMF66690.1 acyl-[acyl-carrier-protein]--UDP-N-acetylglucosamine O-acyltransferase [Paenibacillus uliginis N3/975]